MREAWFHISNFALLHNKLWQTRLSVLDPTGLPERRPEGPIDRFAGLMITARGVPIEWTRDPVDIYAFTWLHPRTPRLLISISSTFHPLAKELARWKSAPTYQP
jgi:hypothetical protein